MCKERARDGDVYFVGCRRTNAEGKQSCCQGQERPRKFKNLPETNTHETGAYSLSEVKWAHREISKDGRLIGQRNINGKKPDIQPNKPSSVSRVFLLMETGHLEVMASEMVDGVNKFTLRCSVVTTSRGCSLLMEPWSGTLYTTLYSVSSLLANSGECEGGDQICANMLKKSSIHIYTKPRIISVTSKSSPNVF